MNRPEADTPRDSGEFLSRYHLKDELAAWCRDHGLPASGSKAELTERIARYIDTGEILPPRPSRKRAAVPGEITPESIIEENIVCSQRHRAFFAAQTGRSFSFSTAFQQWLKQHAGHTYGEALEAYRLMAASKEKHEIGRQFEYNTYIRDFYGDEINRGRPLSDAIACWKYRKSQPGDHHYERGDLAAADKGVLHVFLGDESLQGCGPKVSKGIASPVASSAQQKDSEAKRTRNDRKALWPRPQTRNLQT